MGSLPECERLILLAGLRDRIMSSALGLNGGRELL